MATSDILNSMKAHILDAYDAIEEAGGVVPAQKNLANLEAAIDSIASSAPPITPPDLTKVLDKDALDNLQNIVRQGKAQEYLQLGDQLLVSYGPYTMPFEIVGFDPVQIEGNETVPAINLLTKYTTVLYSEWGADGNTKYSASALRTNITDPLQASLDPNFVACLGKTKTQTYSRDGSTDVVYDKLFAPSMAQLGVTNTKYNSASQASVEGPVFTAYQGSDNAKLIKYAVNATDTVQNYWTRSLYSGNPSSFGFVPTSGAPGSGTYTNAFRVVVAGSFIGE